MTVTADNVIDLSKYTHCKLLVDDELVMFTETAPTFDLSKKRISFGHVAIKDCFRGRYLGTDFVLELYESDNSEEPSIFFYDSGIMKFGVLELVDSEAGRFVLMQNMEFEFDWAHDIKKRLDKALRLAEIEEAERRKREIHVGDMVSFADIHTEVQRVGTVKKINSKHSYEVSVEPTGTIYCSTTRYLSLDKLTKIMDEQEADATYLN